MPQEIRVLCCQKCKMYQVDIVKKAKKWQCKLCGAKQSLFQEFFRGTGAECRLKAQELNMSAATNRDEIENEFLNLLEQDDLEIDLEFIAKQEQKQCVPLPAAESKWTKFVDPVKENRQKYEDVEPTRNLKRKPKSNPDAADKAKTRKFLPSTSSKWNAYL